MRSLRIAALALLFGMVSLVAAAEARAAGLTSLTWTIDSSQSFANLSANDFQFFETGIGTVNVRVRNQTGSATVWNQSKAAIGGTIDTNYNLSLDNAIEFLGGQTNIVGVNSGTYRPNPAAWNGAGYGAPGDTTKSSGVFGASVIANSLHSWFLGQLAFRDVLFDLSTNAPLPISAGSVGDINTANTLFGIGSTILDVDGTYDSLTVRQVLPDIGPGSDVFTGLSNPLGGVGASATGSVANLGGNVRQLTLNMSVPFEVDIGPVPFNFVLTSTIVATASVPEPSSLALGASCAALMTCAYARRRCRHRRR